METSDIGVSRGFHDVDGVPEFWIVPKGKDPMDNHSSQEFIEVAWWVVWE